MDLLDLMAKPYPVNAGWKRDGTSREAAQSVDAKTLRAQVIRVLEASQPLTADEIAAQLRIDKLSIRPRCSELAAMHRIIDSGERHLNSSGKRAIAWCITPHAQALAA